MIKEKKYNLTHLFTYVHKKTGKLNVIILTIKYMKYIPNNKINIKNTGKR